MNIQGDNMPEQEEETETADIEEPVTPESLRAKWEELYGEVETR